MIAPKLKRLREMKDSEVIAAYDEVAEHSGAGTAFFLQELDRRSRVRQNRAIIALTVVIAIFTAITAVYGWPGFWAWVTKL